MGVELSLEFLIERRQRVFKFALRTEPFSD